MTILRRFDHQRTTRLNGHNLKVSEFKTESRKREFCYSGVNTYNALRTDFKAEKFYLLFEQGLKEL